VVADDRSMVRDSVLLRLSALPPYHSKLPWNGVFTDTVYVRFGSLPAALALFWEAVVACADAPTPHARKPATHR